MKTINELMIFSIKLQTYIDLYTNIMTGTAVKNDERRHLMSSVILTLHSLFCKRSIEAKC